MIRACDRAGSSTSTNRSNGTSSCPNAPRSSVTHTRPNNSDEPTPRTLHLRPQHQRVDEHPDQIIELLLTPSSDRRSPSTTSSNYHDSRASNTANAACTTMNNDDTATQAPTSLERPHEQPLVYHERTGNSHHDWMPPTGRWTIRRQDRSAPATPPTHRRPDTPTARDINDDGSPSDPNTSRCHNA